MNRTPITLTVLLGMLVAPAALAADPPAAAPAADRTKLVVVNPGDLHWKDKPSLPPGATGATIWGDPAKDTYDILGKFPAKYSVPMHSHSNDVWAYVLKGGPMQIKQDGKPDLEIKEGGFTFIPAKAMYVCGCTTECTFMVHGEKPFDITYKNPKDDPRAASAKK
jgi:hypothetical protein